MSCFNLVGQMLAAGSSLRKERNQDVSLMNLIHDTLGPQHVRFRIQVPKDVMALALQALFNRPCHDLIGNF